MAIQDKIRNFKLHPLGFYYLTLNSEDVTRRIHVYSAGAGFAAENTWHTHEFDLSSKILAGGLMNNIGQFHPCEGGASRQYEVSYDNEGSKLIDTNIEGSVSEIVRFVSFSGQEYSIKAGVIHKAACVVSPCVTYVSMCHTGSKIFSYGVAETPFVRRAVNDREAGEISTILDESGIPESEWDDILKNCSGD